MAQAFRLDEFLEKRRRLRPAVRLAPNDSWREQNRQQTGGEALHLAQVLQMCFKRTVVA